MPSAHPSLFPSFFMAGFESSTFIWKDGERKNFLEVTGHTKHLSHDCSRVRELGMAVSRESIPWPFVDKGNGVYDWTYVDSLCQELSGCRITPIWDLFHYGLPDGCNPLDEGCLERYLDYVRAVSKRLLERVDAIPFFTPVNEITFFAGACTDMGWMYPFAQGKYYEMKTALCRMAIEAAKAIRQLEPRARFVHVDPLIFQVPMPDHPELKEAACHETYEKAFEAWDILAGRLHPELGGSPEILDIVGVNVYNFSQAQLNPDGTRDILEAQDPRRKPLSEMLQLAWDRYHLPIVISETSGFQDQRAEWLRMTMEESMKALNNGIDLQGVCLYPLIDIPDWNSGEWAKIGVFDIDDKETCERIPVEPYIAELHRWQQILDQPQGIEPDGGIVELDEVVAKAREYVKGAH
ncbi:MAG TPA: family 1 glycosylhydrolase, partial [Fimbriimonas sp.]|nr:family 1 glycosylhydrolase [Fimbriimonas sp.]